MRFTAAGNLGVGTSAPDTRLHVAGGVKIVDGTQGAGKVLTSDASGLASWQTPSGGGGSGDITAVNTAAPLAGGAASGDVSLSLTNCPANQIYKMNGGGTAWACAVDADTVGIGGSGTANFMPKFIAGTTLGNSLVFDNGTNVGVGTSSPTAKLEVAGNVKASGVAFPDATTQTTAAPSNSKVRGINFMAGCDTCTALLDTDDQQDFYVNVIGQMLVNSIRCFSDNNLATVQVLRDDSTAAPIISGASLTCNGTAATLVGAESMLETDNKLDFQVVAANAAKRVTLVIKTTVQ